MKSTAELPPALNESPESTPLFDPEDLELVKGDINNEAGRLLETADEKETPKAWNRAIQFLVAQKRAEKHGFKLSQHAREKLSEYQFSAVSGVLSPGDKKYVRKTARLNNVSSWQGDNDKVDYLSVAQSAMGLAYLLGDKFELNDQAKQALKSVLTDEDKFQEAFGGDIDKAFRFGVALNYLDKFEQKKGKNNDEDNRFFGEEEREELQQRWNGSPIYGEDISTDAAVVRLAQMKKLGILFQQAVDESAEDTYKNNIAERLTKDSKEAFAPSATGDRGEKRWWLKALAVSKSVFGKIVMLDPNQSEAVRALIRADKHKGNWKEYLDDAVLAKQLEAGAAVPIMEGPAVALSEPVPSVPLAAAQTVEGKLDETTEGPIANEPALPTQPEQSTQPEAANDPQEQIEQQLHQELNDPNTPEHRKRELMERFRRAIDANTKPPLVKKPEPPPSPPEIPMAQPPEEGRAVYGVEPEKGYVATEVVPEGAVLPVEAEVKKGDEGLVNNNEEDKNMAAAWAASKPVEAIAEPAVRATEPSPEKGFLKTVQGAREWLREHPKTAAAIMGAAGVGAVVLGSGLGVVASAVGAGYFAIRAGRKALQRQGENEEGYWSAIKNVFKDERSITAEQFRGYGRYVKEGKGFWRKFGRVFTGMSNN